MRRLIVVVLLVALAALSYQSFGSPETGTGSLTLPQPAPNVGERAQTFETPSEEGGSFELKDRGVYVLTFWSTLNRQSNEARPDFEKLARKYSKDGVNFAVVYVNSAPNDESIAYEVLQDRTGNLTSLYNVKRVPRLFLIENGRVRLVQDGYYEGNIQKLENALDDYLGGHQKDDAKAGS